MDSIQIFTTVLGLESPWQIREIRLESILTNEQKLHIYLDFTRDYRFTSHTGEQISAYDTEEKQWQHLNFFQHKCYLHARVPRLKDAEGKEYQIEVPWARAGSGFTRLFEAYAMPPLYPKLGEAYCLRQLFLDVFDVQDNEEAKGYLWFWRRQALEAGVQPFIKFVNMIKAHWSGIVAYFDKQFTNAILGRLNSKIQLAKKRARGHRNISNFMNMIYFLCAKLNFCYSYKTL
jgi:transposase